MASHYPQIEQVSDSVQQQTRRFPSPLNFLKKKRSKSREANSSRSVENLTVDLTDEYPPPLPISHSSSNSSLSSSGYSSPEPDEDRKYVLVPPGKYRADDDATPRAWPPVPIRRASENTRITSPPTSYHIHRSVQSFDEFPRMPASQSQERPQSSLAILGGPMSSSPPGFTSGARSIIEISNGSPNNDLREAWTVATTSAQKSGAIKVLDKLGDGMIASQDGLANVQSAITAVTAAGIPVAQIEQGVKSFVEGSEVLMKALGEVAKLHPFIGVAVMAFRAVWALEMKRRENDKRVLALYGEMKDMMSVLVQLRNVKDPENLAPDGTTIKGRMQELSRLTADDIKGCANACDTYTKKKLVVKVLKGPIWEVKLTRFAGTFTKRRSEFEFALSIHTAVGIDTANLTLSSVDKTVQDMNNKIEMMTQLFQKLVLPEQRDMANLVERKGGVQACIENDEILMELNASNTKTIPVGKTNKVVDISELRDDLHMDPEAAIEKNVLVFNRKFEVQTRQIIDEVGRLVKREGDRIISALTGGPHDKIIDPDLHSIWKEMGWRGSVKVRHFVMTLRDYYHEKWDNQSREKSANGNAVDEWALSYVSILHVQPISEAFDDNASGYVSVQEANDFTSSRPMDWSLPMWIAFWSVGWHQSMVIYVSKIKELLSKMFAILPKIKKQNQSFANDYLNNVYVGIITLCDAVSECIVNEVLQERFQSYIDSEEVRLAGNLEAVDYDIDADDTLRLVAGDGRIEKFVLPLIYLILKRHFLVFRVAQRQLLHQDELVDAADTMQWVFRAVHDRVEILQTIFQQQKLDLARQFKMFAHGMYEFMNNHSKRWDPKIVQASEPAQYTFDENLELPLETQNVLNYPIVDELKDFAAYTARRRPAVSASARLAYRKMLGPWNGFHYPSSTSTVPISGMVSMDLIADGQDRRFKASSRSNGANFTISGSCSSSDTSDRISFTMNMTFPPLHVVQKLKGTWNPAKDTLSGSWWIESATKSRKGVFLYTRMPPEVLSFFPTPGVLKANKARALWTFALGAVQEAIRRRWLTWSFFRERGIRRRRFLELYVRNTRFGRPLDDAELEELRSLQKSLTNADHLFYISIAKQQIRCTVVHAEKCESCGGQLGGSRLSCLTCQLQEKFDTIDFCDDPDCLSQTIARPHLLQPHLPSHDLVKFRRFVHIQYFGKSYRDAKAALERAKSLFAGAPLPASRRVTKDSGSDPDSGTSGCPTPNTLELICAGCRQLVSQPCWFCVHCPEPTFICHLCEKEQARIAEHVIDAHDLVLCQQPVRTVQISVEDRLVRIEEKLEQLEDGLNDRLLRLERLLMGFLEKQDMLADNSG